MTATDLAMAPDSARPNTYPRRSRSFALRSFRKSAAAEEPPPPPSSAAAGPRKATAWPWFKRAEAKATAQSNCGLPASHEAAASTLPAAAVSDADTGTGTGTGTGAGAGAGALPQATPPTGAGAGALPQSTPPTTGPASTLPAAAVSDANTGTGTGTGAGAGALPQATPPTTGPPTPLYDDVELSGLTSQMADFLQRLQRKQGDQQKPAAPPADQKSTAPHRPSFSAEEAAAIRRPISSCAGFGFNYGFRGPISVLQRLLRKVLPGSHHSSAGGDSAMERASGEPDSGDFRHHYHHYIHHHHYHYHFDPANPSLEEGSFPLRSRRHSESGDIRSRIPALICEDDAGDEKKDVEGKGPLSAFLARRRRNSDSIFAERYDSMKATHNSVLGEVKRSSARVGGPADHEDRRWFSWRYNSERYVSKANAGGPLQDGGADEELWKSAEPKSRKRRHSTESLRAGYMPSGTLRAMEEAAMAAAANGAGGRQNLGVPKGDAGNGHEIKAGVARRRSASFVDSCRREEVLKENSRRDGSLLRPPSPASACSRRGQAQQAHSTYSLSSQFPVR